MGSTSGFQPSGRLLFRIQEELPTTPSEEPSSDIYTISAGFIRTMRATLTAGREFTPRDDAGAPPVAIINETLAHRYFSRINPIGRYLLPVTEVYGWGHSKTPRHYLKVVGVVKDIKMDGPKERSPKIYVPYLQYPAQGDMIFVLRTAVPPMSLVSTVRAAVRSMDRETPVGYFHPLKELVAEASGGSIHLSMVVVSIFAGIALLLSTVGIYGVVSFSVGQRRHEIAVRMALGAQPHAVIKLVLSKVLRLTVEGLLLGTMLALALGHIIASFLYGVHSYDPLTLLAVDVIVLVVAIIAAYSPAHRATKIDASMTLRLE